MSEEYNEALDRARSEAAISRFSTKWERLKREMDSGKRTIENVFKQALSDEELRRVIEMEFLVARDDVGDPRLRDILNRLGRISSEGATLSARDVAALDPGVVTGLEPRTWERD